METTFIAKASVVVNASAAKVWEALTEPKLISQYLFGTHVETTWEVGTPITYKGEWQGKKYEDKGAILEVIPEKLLVSTYWSSMLGVPDSIENYKKVTYELESAEGGTKLTVTQDNNPTEEAKAHSESNWNTVLAELKKVVEK